MRKKIMNVLLTILLVYAVMTVIVITLQRSFLYHPALIIQDPATAGVPQMKIIKTRAQDGIELQGWYAPPAQQGKPVILMFHGNGGNIDIRAFKAQVFLDRGYGVLLGEYRGYGGNPGKATEKGFYSDARAYIAFLKEQNIPIQDIVLYGESLGTGVVVKMAAEYQDAKALVLETPYTSFPDVIQLHMFYMPVRPFLWDRFDSISLMSKVRCPVLILHGTADYIVPYSQGLKLFNTANQPKIMETFPMGGHNNLYSLGAGERILSFLDALPHK